MFYRSQIRQWEKSGNETHFSSTEGKILRKKSFKKKIYILKYILVFWEWNFLKLFLEDFSPGFRSVMRTLIL